MCSFAVCRLLSEEFLVACLAIISRRPVVDCVHMLMGGMPAVELAAACLAVVIIVHVQPVSQS